MFLSNSESMCEMSYEMYQCYVGIARVISDFKAGIGAILKQNSFILSISIAVYFLLPVLRWKSGMKEWSQFTFHRHLLEEVMLW